MVLPWDSSTYILSCTSLPLPFKTGWAWVAWGGGLGVATDTGGGGGRKEYRAISRSSSQTPLLSLGRKYKDISHRHGNNYGQQVIVEKETPQNKNMANDLVNTLHPDLIYAASGIHVYNLAGIPSSRSTPPRIMTSLCNFLEEVVGVFL